MGRAKLNKTFPGKLDQSNIYTMGLWYSIIVGIPNFGYIDIPIYGNLLQNEMCIYVYTYTSF